MEVYESFCFSPSNFVLIDGLYTSPCYNSCPGACPFGDAGFYTRTCNKYNSPHSLFSSRLNSNFWFTSQYSEFRTCRHDRA